MRETRRRIRFQARPALVWTLLFFLAGHLILGVYLVHCHPELRGPEYRLHLRDLRARLMTKPLFDEPSCSASAYTRQSAEARAAR